MSEKMVELKNVMEVKISPALEEALAEQMKRPVRGIDMEEFDRGVSSAAFLGVIACCN